MQVLLAAFGALCGLAVGSFLNVVIHRVPRGESVVSPSSACPACGTRIQTRDNIPLVSWLLLRGRCRHCGAPISSRYFLVELATGGVWLACALRFKGVEEAIFAALSLSVLIGLAVIDLEHRRLPNVIVLPATAAALLWGAGLSLAKADMSIFLTAAACAAAGFTLLFVIAVVSRGMGFGDVKLAAFIGLVCGRFGWEVAVLAIFAGFVIGGVAGLVLLIAKRKGRKDRIPFGPALVGGVLVALFSGPSPVRLWLGV